MNIIEYLNLEIVNVSADEVILHLNADETHQQPFGIMHGGVSALLAETAASIGANHLVPENKVCVGLDISSKHLASHRSGLLITRATPVHVGRQTQVWEILITDQHQRKISFSTCSLFVIDKPN